MDQLLEEYLRVINSKDTEIQDLTRGLEESRCELRRREDSHRKSTIETEQELHKLQKRLRKAEEKCRKSEEDVDKLVRHNEQLKVQLSGLHREMMGACGEQAKIQQQVSKADNIEREAMQRLADAHSAQEQRILEQEATIRELRESCEKMQCTMQTMITPQRLDAVISEQKAPLIAATKAQAEEIGELRKLLAEAQQAGPKLRSKLGELKTLYSQLQKNLSDTTRELESERRQRNLEHDAGKEAIARYEREVKQIRGAERRAVEKLESTLLQLQQRNSKTEALEQHLLELEQTLQRERERSGEERERACSQLSALHIKVSEKDMEIDRLHRRLEVNAEELQLCRASMTVAKEEGLHAASEAREKIVIVMAERDRMKEECERLTFEVKEAQHKLTMLQERSDEVKRGLCAKLDSANSDVEKLRDAVREKERQLQVLASAHDNRMRELANEHSNTLASFKVERDNELNDLRQRLDAANLRLAEEAASHSAHLRELSVVQESLRSSTEECKRQSSDAREAAKALEDAKNEVLAVRASLLQKEQQLEVAAENEARLSRSLELVESGRLSDNKHLELLQQSLTQAKEDVKARCDEVQRLRREMEAGAVKSSATANELVECDTKLRAALGQVEQLRAQLSEVRREVEHLSTTNDSLQKQRRAVEKQLQDAEEELRRSKEEVQLKAAECVRVMQHARDVEDMAKNNCEQLERDIAKRDTIIASLQQEVSSLVEERSRVVLLEERLKHQADLHHRDSEALNTRIRLLEDKAAEYNEKLEQKQMELEVATEEVSSLREQVSGLKEEMSQRERKHVLRKEALRNALEKVDAVTERQTEAELGLAKAVASCNKGSDAHMEEMRRRQQMLVRAQEACEAAERRVAEQEKAAKAVSHEYVMLQKQLEQLREQRNGHVAASAEELQHTQEKLGALNAHLEQVRHSLSEALEARKEAELQTAGMQRRVSTTCGRFLTSFVEDAITSKEMFGDFTISFTSRWLREVRKLANHGCDSAYTIQKKYLELQHQKARLGHDIEELSRLHAEELRAVHDDKNKELSKMALQHGADIALLRQEITDLTARAAREGEQQMKEYRRKEEQFHREKTELECARLEIAHQADQITALKEQIRATEQRLGTERADVDHENKELRQQHDRVRHRLEECTRDQARSEQEIRELRNELLALHKVLHEKERALTTEQEKCAEESRRLIAANTVKEALQIQLDELRRQTQKHQERLLAVRQGAERTSSTAAAIQSQMEERVADLTRSLNASEVSKRRMERHFHNEEKKVGALERELAESRRREVELSTQLQARRTEITALKERCANLESLKNINDLTLAETRQRERELFEKIEEMRSAQQMMQICFDKQQEQLEAGRRMHEQGINRSDILYRDGQ
ncbi:basal body component [Trypanosoma vivax]|nr:basal body component [Trypanosoma vivax]